MHEKIIFKKTILVSNSEIYKPIQPVLDPNLLNPWGLVRIDKALWVNNNGSGTLTHYDLTGKILSPVITIPSALPGETGNPTGLIYNPTDGFIVKNLMSGVSKPSLLIGCTEDGLIFGYNPEVNLDNVHILYPRSPVSPSAVYKGLAILNDLLFVCDFRNNNIDVFDKNLNKINLGLQLTNPGYAPFNIASINDKLYVTYAVQDDEKKDDVPGPGHGLVNEITLRFIGNNVEPKKIKRLVSHGVLNSPWGIDVAPKNSGDLAGKLLIGNFGDGTINAFNWDGSFLGTLNETRSTTVFIPGLWSLLTYKDDIYFTAGPNDEADGILGKLITEWACHSEYSSDSEEDSENYSDSD